MELDGLVRMKQLQELVGLRPGSIKRLIARGEFPQPVQISERAIGWRSSEVQAWIDSRVRVTPKEAANV